MLLAEKGEQLYRTAIPFATSVGRITPLIPQEEPNPSWRVLHIANGFTTRWFRPVMHLWEWQGRTTVRFVASQEYDKVCSVEDMRWDMAGYVKALLE